MQIVTRVRGQERANDRRGAPAPSGPAKAEPAKVDEAVALVEREVLKVALQLPGIAGPTFDALGEEAFLVPGHRDLRRAISAAGGTAAATDPARWTEAIEAQLSDERQQRGVHALAVEPLRAGAEDQVRYAEAVLARLQEIVTGRQVAALKSRLQRINPQEQPDDHARLFGELIALEGYRRGLRERAIGAP
jgi:DNA primase